MIKLPSDSLKLALAGLGKIISNRSTLPVLHCVRIERAYDITTITATNLDQWVTATLPREFPAPSSPLAMRLAEARWARENEAMVVPYYLLKEALRGADKGTDLAVEDRDGMPFVLYTFGGNECAAPGAESFTLDEFPVDEEIELQPFARFGPSERTSVIEGLRMSSKDETRYILNGFLLSGTASAIVSTDGRRMFYAPIPGTNFAEDLVVPYMEILRHPTFLSQDWTLSYSPAVERRRKPNGEEIRQHLAEYEEACRRAESLQEDKPKWKELKHVEETVGGNHLRIVSHLDEYHVSWSLKTKLIEGNYPNYRQVIPTEYKALVTLSETTRLKFIELLMRLPQTDAKGSTLSVTLDFAPLGVGIEQKQINFWLDGVTLTGLDNVKVVLDRTFLIDALHTGTCEIRLVDEICPVVFVARGGKFVVQMPMRSMAAAPVNPATVAPEAVKQLAEAGCEAAKQALEAAA